MGIGNFKHKGLKELFLYGETSKIGERYRVSALDTMDILARITTPEDCKGIKNFHELKGKRKATYSMHINKNYCITFKWDGYEVYDVDFEDYH